MLRFKIKIPENFRFPNLFSAIDIVEDGFQRIIHCMRILQIANSQLHIE